MGITFTINMESIKKKTLKGAIRPVMETTGAVYSDLRKFSPIRTGKYVSGHRNKGVRIEKNRVIGEIENIGDYPERVDGGFRKTAVNWNLVNLGQIYHSKGANVYRKALLKNKALLLKKLGGR